MATRTARYGIEPNSGAAIFAGFWANPDPTIVPTVLPADVISDWPPGGRPARGPDAYQANIEALLTALPDMTGEVLEHAVNGDLHFVRWLAHGTGPDGPVEFEGIDRIRLDEDGRLAENVIRFDLGHLEELLGKRIEFVHGSGG